MVTDEIDWTGCPITERDPEKMGGVSTVRAFRVSADSVVANHDSEVSDEEIAYQFTLPLADVRTIIAYAEQLRHSSRTTPRPG